MKAVEIVIDEADKKDTSSKKLGQGYKRGDTMSSMYYTHFGILLLRENKNQTTSYL